jgi:Yip1 domain
VTEAGARGWTALWRRMLRAALLDVALYEEVEADRGATRQAAVAVVLSSVAAGIGAIEKHGAWAIVWYAIAALISWWIWAYVAYWIGTRLLPGPSTRADSGELLRTIGFSSAPGVLRILGLFPPIAAVSFVASTIWMLVAMVIAVRQALDYPSTARALAVCAIGFPIYAATLAVAMLLLGPWPL